VPYLLGHLQERLDQPRGHGIRLVQQRRDQARHRLPQGLGEPGALERRLVRKRNGKLEPKIGGKWRVLAKIFANPDLPEIDDYYEPFTFDYEHLQTAPELQASPTARPRSLITGERMEKIEWGPNWEEILGGEFEKALGRH
jgi:nitrate reductase beta subunit